MTSSPLPAVSDNLISSIGAAQTSDIILNVILVNSSKNISPRSRDLYNVIAKFTKGKVYHTSDDDLYKLIPLIEYGLIENQALVLSRVSSEKKSTYDIPVDRSMKAMTIEANCESGSPQISLYLPNSNLPSFEFVQLVNHMTTGFWLVERTIPGKWSLEIACPKGPHSLVVKSESVLNFKVEHNYHSNGDSDLVVKSLSLPKLKLQSARLIGTVGTEEFGNLTVHHQVARLKKAGKNADIGIYRRINANLYLLNLLILRKINIYIGMIQILLNFVF